MKRYRVYFALAACVAIAWTAWLIYMVKVAADPVVVSAPQLYSASLVVAGTVTVDQGKATVAIVKTLKDSLQPLRPTPLPSRLVVNEWQSTFPADGVVLLALIKSIQGDAYEVAPVPLPLQYLPPRVYRYSDSVRIQAERILAP